jgi:hypothetical protein
MKLVPFEWPGEFSKKSEEVIRNIRPRFKKIYGFGSPWVAGIDEVFALIEPKGKTILDLGCGSINSPDSLLISTLEDPHFSRAYEPWLLRTLHEYGAKCIGIDLGNLAGEKFLGYSKNLNKEDSLSMIKDKSIDLVCAFRLFDSPTGWIMEDYRGIFGFRDLYSPKEKSLFQKLLPQLERTVKKEGYFLFDFCGVTSDEYRGHYSLKK